MFLLFILLFVLFVLFMITYSTHIDMNKKENLPYDFVTFDRFINEFNKYKDNPNLEHRSIFNSWFLYKKDNDGVSLSEQKLVYIHADIIIFDNKCMILYPVDYLKFKLWERKNKDTFRKKGLWDE